jgi:uncharacterized protein YkwD
MRVRPASHRALRRRLSYRTLCGVLLAPVAVLAGVYLAGGGRSLGIGLAHSGSPQAAAVPAASGHSPGPTATPSPSPSARPSRTARKHRPRPSPSASPTSPSPSPSQPSGSAPPPSQQLTAAADSQVLALINQARAQAGLPAYTLSSGLDSSATAHNDRMAGGCGLSHQCPGEPALGTRENDAGVVFTAAGENIGEGGPVADTSSAIAQMAVALTQDMLNEQPPNDGHRLNILSSSFTFAGIAVTIDSSGTVWMTQDFAN